MIKKFIKLFLFFCVIFLLFGFVILYFIKAESEEYAVSFQAYKVEEESEIVDDFINKTLDDLKSFYVLKDDIAKNDFSLTATHIYQLFLINKSVEEVKIISPNGFELLGISRVGLISKEELKDVKEESYFKKAKLGNIYLSDVRLDGQNTYIDIVVPYFENFRFIGIVAAKINFNIFFNEIVSENVPDGGHLHILDKNGIILAALDNRYVGGNVSDTRLFQELNQAKESVIGVKCQPCIEEHKFNIIASAYKSKSQPYFIVALENSEENIFELYYQIRNIFWSIAGLILVVYIVVFLIFNIKLKRRIKILTGGIARFHEGNYGEKIVLKTGDELEYVAKHINHFVSKIEEEIGKKNQAIEKLKEIDILKYNFIKTVSHQLRTPISSMLWLLESLTNQIVGYLSKEQGEIFQDIYKSSQNINHIISDMILMVDIDDNKVALEKSICDFEHMIESVILNVGNQARDKNISIKYEETKIALPHCEIDNKKIKSVLFRLLDNAIKYSESDKEVVLKIEAKEKEIIFSVSDQGIGIPKDEQLRIFTKFYRASNAYKLIQDASGLSLYIAKYFVELHGGRIWFESKENKGSIFYFSIPVK